MPSHCCVVGCKSNYLKSVKESKAVTIFTFPKKDSITYKKWFVNIARKNWKPSSRSVVCIHHFSDEDIIKEAIKKKPDGTVERIKRKRFKLRPNAVPTLLKPVVKASGCVTWTAKKEIGNGRRKKQVMKEENAQSREGTDNDENCRSSTRNSIEQENSQSSEVTDNNKSPSPSLANPTIKQPIEEGNSQSSEGTEENPQGTAMKKKTAKKLSQLLPAKTRQMKTEKELSPTHTIKKLTYSCDVCQRVFPTPTKLRRHVLSHTGEKPFSCDECSKSFTDKGSLNEHMLIHSGEKPMSCDVCQKGFMRRSKLLLHMRMHTGEKPYSCNVCGKAFARSYVLKEHLLVHSGDKPHSCDKCGKGFAQKSQLTSHSCRKLKEPVKEKIHKCGFCDKVFKFNCTLQRHLLTHSREKPYRCEKCGKTFSQKSSLKTHLGSFCKKTLAELENHSGQTTNAQEATTNLQEAITNEQEATTNEQDATANSQEATTNSQEATVNTQEATTNTQTTTNPKATTNKQSHRCGLCHKVFKYRYYLQRHILTHSGEKPHSCETCGKKFTTKFRLKSHLLKNTGICKNTLTEPKKRTRQTTNTQTTTNRQPLSCELCQKVFKFKCSLRKHILTHSEERPHSCDVCQRTFKLKRELERHLFVHSDKKPYSCDKCEKSYTQKTKLELHYSIVHTDQSGMKLFKCEICQKAFRQKHHLKEHYAIHSSEKPFSCTLCNVSFRYKSTLRAHALTHTEERPHTCRECNASFKGVSYLTKHMKTHSRPYVCEICLRAFSRGYRLKDHMKLHKRGRLPSQSIRHSTRKRKDHLAGEQPDAQPQQDEYQLHNVQNLQNVGQRIVSTYLQEERQLKVPYQQNGGQQLEIPVLQNEGQHVSQNGSQQLDTQHLQNAGHRNDGHRLYNEGQQHVIQSLQNSFIYCHILTRFRDENVRSDFLMGTNRAVQLTREQLSRLDQLHQVISPGLPSEQTDVTIHFRNLAEHHFLLMEGANKEILGTTYKEFKDLLQSIRDCGYFSRSAVSPREDDNHRIQQTYEPSPYDVWSWTMKFL